MDLHRLLWTGNHSFAGLCGILWILLSRRWRHQYYSVLLKLKIFYWCYQMTSLWYRTSFLKLSSQRKKKITWSEAKNLILDTSVWVLRHMHTWLDSPNQGRFSSTRDFQSRSGWKDLSSHLIIRTRARNPKRFTLTRFQCDTYARNGQHKTWV